MANSEVITGVGKIWGLDQDSANPMTVTSLTGAATITLDSADGSDDFELAELKDQVGDVETLIASNRTRPVNLSFAPNGATRAAAKTSLANCLPGPLTKATIAQASVPFFNGDYNYIGGWAVKVTRDGIVIVTMRIKAYIKNRASLTSGVISG